MTNDRGDQAFCEQLAELARFIEQTESLERGLDTLARLVAHAMDCAHCSIMLVKRPEGSTRPVLRVEAHYGHLPAEAYAAQRSLDSGIAGRVAATGEPLLIRNLHASEFGPLAQREPSGTEDVISVPIMLEDAVVGVINIDSPAGREQFGSDDLRMATVLALVVSQSIRIHRLKGLLRTSLMQSLLARADVENGRSASDQVQGEPERVVRVLAQTLFREMDRVGFARDHILGLATELIARVSDDLSRDRHGLQPAG